MKKVMIATIAVLAAVAVADETADVDMIDAETESIADVLEVVHAVMPEMADSVEDCTEYGMAEDSEAAKQEAVEECLNEIVMDIVDADTASGEMEVQEVASSEDVGDASP